MTAAILLGAGRGTRLGGGTPKALRVLGGKPLLQFSLDTLEVCRDIRSVIIVVPPDDVDQVRTNISAQGPGKVVAVVAGGARRQDSVQQGLSACPPGTEWVAIHDAARPFASVDLFRRTIERARQAGGAVAAQPVSDTIKRARELSVVETLPRSELWAAQTPQVFRLGELQAALAACAESGREVTDDALAMELAGHAVALVESDSTNFKISTAADWIRAEQILAGGA